MTWRGLLVSVRDADEARAALDGGANIIDVKDPAAGSLGAAAAATVAAIAAAVEGRVPWTAAAGELRDEVADPGRTRRWLDAIRGHLAAAGVAAALRAPAAIKFGLAGMASSRTMEWRAALHDALHEMPAATTRVAVAYADWQRVEAPDPVDVVAAGAATGCAVYLIDTADKKGAALLHVSRAGELGRWIAAARDAGMSVALAGRIALAEIPCLRRFMPDVVALRSAVCSNGRTSSVDPALVRRAAAEVGLLETASRAATRDSRAPFAGA